jgi:hypothetical protein
MASVSASGSVSRAEPATQDISPNTGEQLLATDTALAFDGWQQYPQNLATSSRFPQILSFHSSRLNSGAEKLFRTPEDAVVKVVACDLPVSGEINGVFPLFIYGPHLVVCILVQLSTS